MTASEATSDTPKVGEVFGGKYQVVHVLGVGGMGAVVAARHMHLGQLVAIKIMLSAVLHEGEATVRFLREGRAAAALKTEHAVRVLDVGTTPEGRPYLVMEYLEGKDASALLEERGPLPVHEAASILLQACEAVAEAHSLGIVHRDLKPSNLFLIERDGQPFVKVLDFGISKFLDGEDNVDQSLTGTRTTLGTPLYMSPEQVRSAKNVDRRTDIWALGVILYELLVNRPPFEAVSFSGLCAAIIADPPTPIRQVWPEVPAEIEALLGRCFEKNPALRLASIEEFVAALRPFVLSSAPPLISAPRLIARAASGEAATVDASSQKQASSSGSLARFERISASGDFPRVSALSASQSRSSGQMLAAQSLSGTTTPSAAPTTGKLGVILGAAGLLLGAGALLLVLGNKPPAVPPPPATTAPLAPALPPSPPPPTSTATVIVEPVAEASASRPPAASASAAPSGVASQGPGGKPARPPEQRVTKQPAPGYSPDKDDRK